ncbi:Protein HGH1-like protein [Yarrowia sp. B02]|nr:Protein HGH1-like protein [Yarrowia sp. B02]
MSSEFQELIQFLHSDHPAVKQVALQSLKGYSTGHAEQFKANDYQGVKDLVATVMLGTPRVNVENALTILINLCDDRDILDMLASNSMFVAMIACEICDLENKQADLCCMLLANLAKDDHIVSIFDATKKLKNEEVFKSEKLIDSLMDCFVKGATGKLNLFSNYDYLAFFFADLSRFRRGRDYFVTEQPYDGLFPIQKLLPFTEFVDSRIRREGVASTIKNSLFDTDKHSKFVLDPEINLLPFLMLPLAGPEDLEDPEEIFDLPEELQLLTPDKRREEDLDIMCTHLESLLLLTTSREMREYLRTKSVYPIVRELHKNHQDETIQERCDRVVQMLMRDEPKEEGDDAKVKEIDSDDEVVEVL